MEPKNVTNWKGLPNANSSSEEEVKSEKLTV
jgi:hypothetical protein